ncbi:hypothetical protein ACIRPH_30830 [Nocardiopsis sp. NPDC101807]|uniref:hypothetical protein n=1 Tax=Nocardiopsis sp. NPDC101807 TaxID=3364339 RepID=UPI00382C5648
MSADMSLDQMGFRDFLEAHRRNLSALEAAYEAGIDGTGALSELTELFDDAGFSLVLARSKATADLRDLEAAAAGDMVPEDVDGLPQELVDAILADAEDGLLDLDTLHDPVPVWTEGERAAALPDRDTYRADHPFPIDDEEVQW